VRQPDKHYSTEQKGGEGSGLKALGTSCRQAIACIASCCLIIETIYATNSDGKKAFIVSVASIDSASAGIWASVSNRCPHFTQDQRLRTSRSLMYSDQSGANSVKPHLAQIPRSE